MLKSKEFKGTIQEPNVDSAINKFFLECDENVNIFNLYYSTTALPYKTSQGAVAYQTVSSCLVFYDDGKDVG